MLQKPRRPKNPRLARLRNPDLSRLEQALLQSGVQCLAGVDETGRGCLAGPVVAACVIYPSTGAGSSPPTFPRVADSKILSPRRREELCAEICSRALAWAVAEVEPTEIDRVNIHWASLRAMQGAVEKLRRRPDYLLVDGRFPLAVPIPQQAVIDGDAKCQVIAAASIVAKVWRDRLMCRLEEVYPKFQFGQHKGYGTQQHREELRCHGPTPIHRKSFHGVIDPKHRLSHLSLVS